MLQFIAMLAPAVLATAFYSHLHDHKFSTKKQINLYAAFLIFINLACYISFMFLFGYKKVRFSDTLFIQYLSLATGIALVAPILVSMLNLKLSIKVRKHGKKI